MYTFLFLVHLFSLSLSSTPVIATSPGVFDVTSYGGVGDGTTLNTKAFQSAVAAAHSYYITTGNTGTVLVPSPGTFFSGQIVLLGGVTLSITTGATLLASPSASDYPTDQSKWAFLYSNAANHIEVSGGGQVDGNYQHYIGGWVEANDEFIPTGWAGCSGECRPRLAMFVDSVGVVVHDVTFKGSPDWTFHLLNATYVHVYNWTQRGDERWPNNDGIDLDSCNHVLVEDSDIDTADDGVCLKGSALNGTSINVTVRNTRIRSRSSAVKFGSNCPILFQNHTYENLYIHDSNRGLALQVRDGGLVTDITFRNITINGTRFWPFHWWGDGGPLYISTMLRDTTDPGTVVSNILFEDIVAFSENPAVFSGVAPGKAIVNVTLRRVDLTLTKLGNYSVSNVSGPTIEYDPHLSPGWGRVNLSGWMPGVYAEGVEGLTLEDVNVRFDNAKYQWYWGAAPCVNTTQAGSPVKVIGGSCTPPSPTLRLL